MKKVAIIGSPDLHKNYQTALEKAGCGAVIFPDSSYVNKHREAFDGLLLPGGGDVFSSLADYMPFLETPIAGHEMPTDSGGRSAHFNRNASGFGADFQLTIEQFRALHLFFEQKKPVLGICKGMQLINLYFHGTIREVSNRNLHRKQAGDVLHPADNLPGSFLHALFGPHMLINSNHHQCVDLIGQNLQIIQYASDKTAEAVSHLSAPILGTQWHPERMPELHHQDATLLFCYFISLL